MKFENSHPHHSLSLDNNQKTGKLHGKFTKT